MELIKKIYQTPRNWVDIDHDLSKLKSTDVAGKIGMKLVDLLVRHDRPQLLQKLFSKAKKIDVSFIDRYGRTVLHNAVANRSVKTLHILLENGAKPQINKRDRFWFFGPLHFAVINNDASSIKELIRYGADVNLKADFTDLKKTDIDNTGWLKSPNRIRPIHLASITGRLNIIKILIAHGARVNSHAERDGITSLFMAAIEYSNKETPDRKRTQLLATINYLISKGAKIGSVNYDGESILYYKSIWENDELFDIFVDGIDVNIINYNKDTVLHNRLLLNTLPQTKKEIAKQRRILKKMDSFYINYPNVFYYDTILHLYAKNGLWKQLENVLSTKYLDIYAMNKEGDRPIDFIAKRDRQRFFKMVAAGYHWCLQHCPHVKPITTWEKICKKLKSTDKDIKTLQRLSGHTHCINVDSLCELVASRMIAKSKKSYPTLAKMDINLSVKGKFKNNWWSATAFEIFFGLLYLAKKYSAKKVCFLTDFSFINNTDKRYHSVNDIFEDNIHKFCFTWRNDVLKYNKKYSEALRQCSSRFFAIPLALNYGRSNEGHFGSILIDNDHKTIERFEPHGYKSSWYHNQRLLDKRLRAVFGKILPRHKYITPREYISRIGFQGYDSTTKQFDITQFVDMAYCIVWSFWYLDLRIQNPDVSRGKAIELAMLKIHKNFTSSKKFIMTYANLILKQRDKVLKECSIAMDDYVAERTTVQDVNCLLRRIKNNFF